MAIRFNGLTKTKIDALKPTDKPYQVSDSNTGLLLKIYPTGAKSWIFSYTHPITGKRIPKKTIGKYPFISLSEAREIRDGYKALLAKGIDPFEEQERAKVEEYARSVTVREIGYKWIDAYSVIREHKPETRQKILRRLENHLFPLFGDCEISKIKASDVIEKFQPMQDDGLIETLRRTLKHFIQIMAFALNRDLISHNPIAHVLEEFKKKSKMHQPTITPEELPEFLRDLEKSNTKRQTKLLIKFQLLSALRCNEACRVEWDEIDWENKIITVPALKMKGGKREHVVPITTQIFEILEEMKTYNGHRQYIFSSPVNKKGYLSKETVNKAIQRIANEKYKDRLVAHGLRSIASTYLHDKFTTEYHAVEACLSHRDKNSVASAYNRGNYLTRRRELMQAWGDFVSVCERA
ncbi:MAG: tyrosine-type recombinase/integrase [Haemophilus paraphrohaemolyticus]|jgi:integrase|uniref:tyrosine-type recombinase/integrase n=1 Tax=Haemophilus TaxID=724 RepID=UPI001CF8966E|nr:MULTISPECIES: tyrosine-type recombinase/integrase [Haemophilus]MBS6672814.1 tyrosine-type recombinase/integrase [Haemophilus paraphrohaemolyticus]